MWRISWSGLKKKKEKKKLSECKWAPCVVVLWRREASGEARSCCTFNSSLAIWSVPLREREEEEEEGGAAKVVCTPSSPLLSSPLLPPFFLCDGTGADLWWWWREGKKRSRGAHLHLITPRLLARYKTLCRAGDPSDIRTVKPRAAQRHGDFRISISL